MLDKFGGVKEFVSNNRTMDCLTFVLNNCIEDMDKHRLSCVFALSCINNFEKEYPEDKRPREAIEAKLLWIDGKISIDELSAAESAARSAARSAESAARSAARSAAWSAESAESAAESAAWSAAWSARSAARSAAWVSRVGSMVSSMVSSDFEYGRRNFKILIGVNMNIIYTEDLLTKLYDKGIDTTVTLSANGTVLLELFDTSSKAVLGVIRGDTVENALVDILLKLVDTGRVLKTSHNEFEMLSRL